MPRFSLRTLLILTAMLGVLLAQRPYTRIVETSRWDAAPLSKWFHFIEPEIPTTPGCPDIKLILTNRFRLVAMAEIALLTLWAGAILIRRPTHPSSF